MKNIVLGILAHVDSGKTTLSESMLFECKSIRKLGRVDHGDTALDTNEIEKNRGITVFSKQAKFVYKNTNAFLLDTPGHVDFSSEMERTLAVLDYAILVISGTDGIQNHTETLWNLLQRYEIPTVIFVNKMDLNGADKTDVLNQLKIGLSGQCVDFTTLEFTGTVTYTDILLVKLLGECFTPYSGDKICNSHICYSFLILLFAVFQAFHDLFVVAPYLFTIHRSYFVGGKKLLR